MRRSAFTLIELLVVVAIVALLIGVLVPGLAKARETAVRVLCLTRLNQTGTAIYAYSNDFEGSIPYGPAAPPPSPTNFYPVTGSVTSLISLQSGKPVGIGLIISPYLSKSPLSIFCPGVDQPVDANKELAKVGIGQAECSYYYRHASGGDLSVEPGTDHIRLASLGLNTNGDRIHALAIDVQQLANAELAMFGVRTRTAHKMTTANVLFDDGHAATLPNDDNAFTVDLGSDPHSGFALILKALETADGRQ
jgi:prepilin-type N-terminal cleavage/methylation domain-containing protein